MAQQTASQWEVSSCVLNAQIAAHPEEGDFVGELPLALAFGGLASNAIQVSRAYRLKEERCDSLAKQDNFFEGSVEKCELKS
ncbi:hypothetical protein DV515_00004218 [Chloebia gouldiae]|uniref:Uncharacterized protein n=1 Tax=Chloebia gouldiae TaxID=44316 RepID=A0A3L8SRQ2_CHLGU|nr:hypothetical protein DV515_00004218 [Chloebia gouldiae]